MNDFIFFAVEAVIAAMFIWGCILLGCIVATIRREKL